MYVIFPESPVSVTMRIRHYFSQQHASYQLPPQEKKFSTLPKQTKEKTSQTSPKKPLRTSTKKNIEENKLPKSSKLLSSQSLRISSSVPSLGNAKGLVETDRKVGLISIHINKVCSVWSVVQRSRIICSLDIVSLSHTAVIPVASHKNKELGVKRLLP